MTVLPPAYGNAYWRVTTAFPLYGFVGVHPSNTYVGTSRAYGNVYERITAQPGDEIHALVGGIFLVRGDRAREVRIQLRAQHLFEKGGSADGEWPLDRLTAIRDPAKPESYRAKGRTFADADLDRLGAQPCGRSLDYIYGDH